MKYVKGDLIKLAQAGEFNAIGHGCNCYCVMGAGIAPKIKAAFPDAYTVDAATRNITPSLKLGTYSLAKVENLFVYNLYTQKDYTIERDEFGIIPNVNYAAVRCSLVKMRESLIKLFGSYPVKIGLPKIGCGLAGGDWEIVSKIIEQELDVDFDVTIVVFD